ncbi:MAG: hypothetical protein E7231_03790 [Cellulosilyticum sp.]|nr:hypothetical protein [Cellulosilyticum sp.]
MPKFREAQNRVYENKALIRWLTFLQKDISREVLEELMEMEPAIKMAEEKLDYLSSDPETTELYKAREYSAHERANLLSTGIERGKREVAIALLDILDDETIALKTGLSIQEVCELRRKEKSNSDKDN